MHIFLLFGCNPIGLKIRMYISSLWLLFAMLIVSSFRLPSDFSLKFKWVEELFAMNVPSCICGFMLLICALCIWSFKTCVDGTLQLSVKIRKVEDRNADFLLLLSTYIIPLVTIKIDSPRHAMILVILLVAIGVIYVKTNLYLANPTLALVGYKVYAVGLGMPDLSGVAITRDDLRDGDDVMFVSLGRGSFYLKKVS